MLSQHFCQIGPVSDVQFFPCNGVGKIVFETQHLAQKAVAELDGTELDGSVLHVAPSRRLKKISHRQASKLITPDHHEDSKAHQHLDQVTGIDCMHNGAEHDGRVRILAKGDCWAVVEKPAGIPCHYWRFYKPLDAKRLGDMAKPLLQQVEDILGAHIHLVHRLDQGTSGAVLVTVSQSTFDEKDSIAQTEQIQSEGESSDDDSILTSKCSVTAALQAALASPVAQKTYYALARGEGSELQKRGTFMVDRPVRGPPPKRALREAQTEFTFLCGCRASRSSAGYCPLDSGLHNGTGQVCHGHNTELSKPASAKQFADTARPGDYGRACLVRCKIRSGRWHQIRRHLNGLSMHLLGDQKHGDKDVNKEWQKYGLLQPGRLALHCARLQIPATAFTPELDVTCPLPQDLRRLVDALPFAAEARRVAPEMFTS
eukprot:gnl/MRDRNA2_/MRDRNA2_64589_c0_seq1.p1 gnl/MRDRNA2_/MRDRNA2_64589_c0~~gnl/MRDRNA2_/MRDRNA2_64589_c0_seq1.p1  ORF type:complete len:429 (-),score=66.02 gnl/MRDRNA2_/MRDRNA2_64589_c0_seq1:74-1360(-)